MEVGVGQKLVVIVDRLKGQVGKLMSLCKKSKQLLCYSNSGKSVVPELLSVPFSVVQ